ncbi:hypothetical protein [Microvirga sp. Mcv34]|uniref:hypothetical protein n=1 Tax=Microvirga sp. Mcv34 TaxID=2926016 RepID=UPI0021C6F2CE|nr:hypothetical protein [Microvirga sp. Mcv34]
MRCEPLSSKHLADLHIDEDLPMQRVLWRFERSGWAILAGFVGAALLGLFGEGWLSRVEAQVPSGALAVRYDRFTRNDTPTIVEVRLTAANPSGLQWLSLSGDYLKDMRIDRVVPEPEQTLVFQKTIRFGFDPGQAGDRTLVTLTLSPSRPGLVRGAVVVDSSKLPLVQFVYP